MPRIGIALLLGLMIVAPLGGARYIDDWPSMMPSTSSYGAPAGPYDAQPPAPYGAPPTPADATTDAPNTTSDWPRDGSYATYAIYTLSRVGSGAMRESFGNATFTYGPTGWTLACEASFAAGPVHYGGSARATGGEYGRSGRVPYTPTAQPPLVIESIRSTAANAWRLDNCELTPFRVRTLADGTHTTPASGATSGGSGMPTWSIGGPGVFGQTSDPYGSSTPFDTWRPNSWTTPTSTGNAIARWDPDTGLLTSWDASRGHTINRGTLVATDAPGVQVTQAG